MRSAPPWRRALAILFTSTSSACAGSSSAPTDATRAFDFIAGLANWSQPATLLTPFLGSLIAFGLAIQFTPGDMLERLD